MPDEIPPLSTSASRGGVPLSLVWLVPLVAVAVALFIAWQTYASRGPLIEVSFPEATGLVAGTTELKFRSLNVGLVEKLSFSSDLQQVIAHIRLNKDIAQYVDASAQFWIVQPEVSARGITGLETVLSGSYIQGSWDSTPGKMLTSFQGLDAAPLAPSDEKGTVIKLRSDIGGRVHAGAPVVYRGVTVGEMDEPVLALDGSGVTANAFIKAPYDKLLNTNTRFWGTGGISLDIGAGGVSLNVANLASIIQGGTTFETVVSGGRPIKNGHQFQVYPDKATAERTILDEGNIEALTYSAIFEGTVAGLSTGASVIFGGVTVGQVTDLGVYIDDSEDGSSDVKLKVDFALQPRLLGIEDDPDGTAMRAFLVDAVADGLHAELVNQSLISSQLRMELIKAPDGSAGTLDLSGDPYPILPSLPVDLADLSASAEGIFNRIAALPIEALIDNAVSILSNANALISSPEVQKVPDSVVALLDQSRSTIEAFDPKPLMDELQGTAADLRSTVAALGNEANRELISSSLNKIDTLLAELDASAKALPDLMASAQSVADKAAALELAALVSEATQTIASINAVASDPAVRALPADVQGLIADARDLVSSEAVQAVPQDVATALGSVQSILNDFQSSGALPSLLASLERLDSIANSVETTSAGLPQLREQISDVLAKAQALDLQTLLASATATATSVQTLAASPEVQALPAQVSGLITDTRDVVGSDAVKALPGDLSATLARLDALLSEVQQSDGVASLMTSLERLDAITASIETTTAGLPQLREQISDVVAKADAIPVEELVRSADDLLNSANAFMGSDETAAVPASLTAALDEVAAVLAELRAGGTVENVNAALASAAQAASAIEAAAASLPELTARLNGLIADADALMATYGTRSAFNAQTLSALNDIRQAARAVTDLSRAIERNPSSLIRGR